MNCLEKIVKYIDKIVDLVGKIFGITIIIPLILSTVYDIILRYFFHSSTVWAYELTWMLYAAFFLMGGAYTLKEKGHVRVDILFSRFTPKRKALIDGIFLLVFFLPLVIIITKYSIPWAWRALIYHERAQYTIWRPYVFPVKVILPISFILLGLQGISEIIKNFVFAIKGVEL